MAELRVKDLFELPESIHRIQFVEQLSQAVTTPEATASKYVVTPALRDAFDRALAVVGKSLKDQRSQAGYLHGSFGSGKSHFMALLSLMLEGHEAVWRVPELHPLRERHAFAGKAKLLQLRFHLVGAPSLEHAIFPSYIAHVRAQHPGASVPALFADARLFEDARRVLEELGEEAFFAPMNASAEVDEAWGDRGGAELWTRARFEAAVASTELTVRESLLTALVSTRFGAFLDARQQLVDLDGGLATLARHAKGLGYGGVVLFLDEIILWLAGRASDAAWFHGEVQKLVKLVEAQDASREIPIVSFLARQRDLAEMVGDEYAGIENARLRDSLKWSELRYEKITLEDRNLPAIVERRVLRPKDGGAKAALDSAFAKVKGSIQGASWHTLLGQLDGEAFRQLYPFSPALVEALVALSNSLQRERTAIRLLTEILVEHVEDLQLGDVVGVGDLFDVLAGGEDTADGVMRARFESAKQLYQYQLLPVIQAAHGTTTPDVCQRLRGDKVRLGCSNCPKKACRADNRLVKTLLVAALVPEVPALKDLTASKLAALNHGSIKAPFGGDAAQAVATKLKKWASEVGQLHLGSQADPTVRLQIEGVDLGPILEAASAADTDGARQNVLKGLLFAELELEPKKDVSKPHKHEWRGTDRLGTVYFGNVRRMSPEQLRCPEEHDWRLVIDYPFDQAGFGPQHDEKVLEEFRDQGGSWTLVWLPSFFSAEMNGMLGKLARLEHILESPQTTRGYVAHLSVENQGRAINDLTNLRTQQQARVRQALEQAYGIVKPRDGDLDPSLMVERHLIVPKAGVVLAPTLASSLSDALGRHIDALLDARYPRHPRFTKKLTARRADDLLAKVGELVDSETKQLAADRALVEEMRATLEQLGLVRVSETTVFLLEDRLLMELENRRRQRAEDRPTVAEVKRWIDESGKMGLETAALDMVVRAYARWSARTFVSGDRPYEVSANRPLPDDVVLERPELPSASDWAKALAMADASLGVQLPGVKALHADNLKRFEGAVLEKLKLSAAAVIKLPGLLRGRYAELEVPETADRVVTAAAAEALATSLSGKRGQALVEALAAFVPKTSAKAVGASWREAKRCGEALEDRLGFGVFAQLAARQATVGGAAEVLEKVAAALRQDELNVGLTSALRDLALLGQDLLKPPPKLKVLDLHLVATSVAAARQQLGEWMKAVEALEGEVEIRAELSAFKEGEPR